MNGQTESRRVFMVFRYTDMLKDTVDLIKEKLEQERDDSPIHWQIQVLDKMVAPSTVLFHGVMEAIRNTDFVVVFSESMSMNVAFEAGVAFALAKPTVICVPEGEIQKLFQSFSDLSGIKVAQYNRDRFMEIPKVVAQALSELDNESHAKSKEPPGSDYLVGWAETLRFNGHHREAIEKYAAGIAKDPRSVRCHVGMGEAYLAVYDLVRAEKALRKAIDLQRDAHHSWEVLGQVLLDSGQYEEATKAYEKLLHLMPGRREYYFKLAVAYSEMQRPEKGVEVLEDAVERFPSEAGLHYDLGWCAARAARKSKGKKSNTWAARAIEALNRATGLDGVFYGRVEQDSDFDHLRGLDGFPTKPQLGGA